MDHKRRKDDLEVPIEERDQRRRDDFHHSRQAILDDVEFCLSRPDILQAICRISISTGYCDEIPERIVGDISTFWASITSAVARLLTEAVNTAVLFAMNVPLSFEYLKAAATLSKLHTVYFRYCGTVDVSALTRSSSVLNAHLSMSDERTEDQWHLLILFPELRTLDIRGRYDSVFGVPHPGIRQHLPVFRRLQRLCLEQFDVQCVIPLSDWLRASASAFGGLHITHFKLQTPHGLVEQEAPTLLAPSLAPQWKCSRLMACASSALHSFTTLHMRFRAYKRSR